MSASQRERLARESQNEQEDRMCRSERLGTENERVDSIWKERRTGLCSASSFQHLKLTQKVSRASNLHVVTTTTDDTLVPHITFTSYVTFFGECSPH